MMRRKIWLTLGLLLCGGVVAWTQSSLLRRAAGFADPAGDLFAETAAPTRVGALGRIEPSSEIVNIGAPMGDRLKRLLVTEGQRVAVDEEVASLESYEIVAAEKQEITALLEEAKARAATTRIHGAASIRSAELRLKTVEQLEPLRIDSKRASLAVVEADAKRIEDEYRRAERLLATKAISREDHDRRNVEHYKQQEMLKSSRLALAEQEAGYSLSRDSALADLELAKAALQQALAAIPVQSLEGRLSLIDARLRQTIIRAPIAGQVLKVHTKEGERIGNGPILKLGNTDDMHVVAEVYETEISRIRVGQRAAASCSALGKPISGTVVKVGVMIHKNDVLNVDPAADADARVVEVRIKLDEPQRAASLTHLQVDVLIDLDQSKDEHSRGAK